MTSRDEPFIDLSLDVVQNSSISSCLQHFSLEERLARQDKFYCDQCCSLQEAQKVRLLFQTWFTLSFLCLCSALLSRSVPPCPPCASDPLSRSGCG